MPNKTLVRSIDLKNKIITQTLVMNLIQWKSDSFSVIIR